MNDPSLWTCQNVAVSFSRPAHEVAKLSPDSSPAASGVMLTWIFYVTLAEMVWMAKPLPLPTTPVTALEPFRIANRYGLFAMMTRGRYEIEFQGSEDGQNWLVYPFRYKPQDPSKAPGIYAPWKIRWQPSVFDMS